jgi:glutathione S-transferase
VIRLYDYLPSGNGYKLRLLLCQLGIPFELVEMDITKGETRTPEFLHKNPNGRIPLIELENGEYLAESGATLFYFADGSRFLPDDRWQRAQTLQWMFFEQYSHEPYIAVARAWLHLFGLDDERRRQLPQKQKLGYDALGVMESHLATRTFFVADRYTIADIALYAYTHVASEGGFDLGRYPAVQAWLQRVREQPGHVTIHQRDFPQPAPRSRIGF